MERDIIKRDAIVKRFEYSFELCWKTIKEFLSTNFGSSIMYPKEAFRGLVKLEMISPEETEILIIMVDDRNFTAHTYDEEFINGLVKRLPRYYEVMEKVMKLIKGKMA